MAQPILLPHVFFAADPPDLPVRPPGDGGGPDALVVAEIAEATASGVSLRGTTRSGDELNVTVAIVAPGVVRVLLEDGRAVGPRVRLARDPAGAPVDVARIESAGRVALGSESISVELALDPFGLRFAAPTGETLLEQNGHDADVTGRLRVLPFGVTRVDGRRAAFHDTFTAEPDEHFYGFGERFTSLDKRGQRVELWHYDAWGVGNERAYKNVPFFLSTRGYGLFVDSTSFVNFDMAASNHATWSLIVPDEALDYYVIAGPEPKAIIRRYAELVGFPTVPPKWAFGLWVSSGFVAEGAEDVLERARLLREHEIPCDVLHLDAYWQRHGSWSDLRWAEERFPDPGALIAELKGLGFKICLWMNSYFGHESERFLEAAENGYLLKTPSGEPYVADLWSGHHPPVGILDPTSGEAIDWFKSLLRPLLEAGVDVFKTDFGEGVPADAVASNGMTGERLHNLYPLLYNDAVSEVTAEVTGRAGFVWTRSTWAGGQRHGAQWGGDPNSTYQDMASTLRGGLSLGMCGHPFWSHDIGGFSGRPTADLYVRWAQFGLFSPLSRAHGTTTRVPWDYGEEALRIFREYTRLRYSLLPYIYSYARRAAKTSVPLMRAMVLEFPDDPGTYGLDLQYMLGAELLVAPIYNADGRRPVYLPAGRWVDFWTRELVEGPRNILVEARLDVLPLYVRADALIPTIEPSAHLPSPDQPFEGVTFDCYLIERGRFELWDCDGRTAVSASREGTRVEVDVAGPNSRVGVRILRLPGVAEVEGICLNGAEVSWTRDADGAVRAG
jgi:alpha-D-xyloside xylohydrolase